MIGHRLLGSALFFTGDLAGGRAHHDRAIALYDMAAHRSLANRFGQDMGVTILTWRHQNLWILGYPEAALADVKGALEIAHETGQVGSLIYAQIHAGLTHMYCGNLLAAQVQWENLLVFLEEKGALFWQSIGATLVLPYFLSFFATACAELGQFDKAWNCIGEAIMLIERTKQAWCEAEVNRVAGEIALRSPAPDAVKAESY